MADPIVTKTRLLTRDQIRRIVGNDPRGIAAIEAITQDTARMLPDAITVAQALAESAQEAADSAMAAATAAQAAADQAAAMLTQLQQAADVEPLREDFAAAVRRIEALEQGYIS